jgi:hypothetical protein
MEVGEFSKNLLGKVRDFVVITDEAIQKECLEGRQMVWFVDVTTETKPFGVSTWTVPEKSGNFCSRGGRFGTHSSNESFTPIYYKRIMFFAHFNAGVRAVDIRDPFNPKEIGYYIPAMNEEHGGARDAAHQGAKLPFTEASKKARSRPTTSRSTTAATSTSSIAPTRALHILELTGPARDHRRLAGGGALIAAPAPAWGCRSCARAGSFLVFRRRGSCPPRIR